MSNCPSCNSSNTKTLNMVWSGGTRNGKSGFSGVGISTGGRITVGGGRGLSQWKKQRDVLETAIANVDRQIQPCLPFDL